MLAEVSTTVEHVKDRAIDASEQLTTIVARIADLDTRLAGFEVIGAQVGQMTESCGRRRKRPRSCPTRGDSSRSTARRWSSSQLNTGDPGSNRSAGRRAPDRDERHAELQRFHADLRGALDQAAGIKRDLDELHSQASALANDSCHQQDRGPGTGQHRKTSLAR